MSKYNFYSEYRRVLISQIIFPARVLSLLDCYMNDGIQWINLVAHMCRAVKPSVSQVACCQHKTTWIEMGSVPPPANFFKPMSSFTLLVANRLEVQENIIGSKFPGK